MQTVLFHENQLGIRGTSVALYDYALYNKLLLGNKSMIAAPSSASDMSTLEKFKNIFDVYIYDKLDELYSIPHDVFYTIKYGFNDNIINPYAKTCVHCVFSAHHPHGDVYSTIAPWVQGNNGQYPVVPHIVQLPDHNDNLREELNIPSESLVFGGYGGEDNFSIEYVQKQVFEIASNYSDIYFLFANFKRFCPELPNIIHIPMMVSLEKKVSFINTCDAMLWARKDGEIMSMSQGEFSSKNKPIICTESGYLGHKYLLQDKAIWYNQSTLKDILLNFDRNEVKNKDWNAYKDYTPEKVMNQFKAIFL